MKDQDVHDSWRPDARQQSESANEEGRDAFTLNSQQLAAATTDERHVLVKAGAGTGKTATIIARCAHLIESGVPPNRIQTLAFTRRAANEVRTRVRSQLGAVAEGLPATTFHAWCMQLLRGNEGVWGYEGWTVIDGEDQLLLFRTARGERPRGFPTAKQLLSAYSFSRNTGTRLSVVAQDRFGMKEAEAKENLGPIARAYEAKKRENRYLDYDDILVIVGKRLSGHPALAEWVGEQFPYILVDEMQDTNPIQWDILLPLVPYTSLYCVGDDAQSIYGFRGASFEYLHHFQEVVEGSVVLDLTKNYRSTQPVLDLANWLLTQSPIGYEKELEAVRPGGDPPEVHDFRGRYDAAAWIGADIEEDERSGLRLQDHLVLARAGYQARAVEGELLRRGIPYNFFGGTRLLEGAHVRDLLSALRVVANPLDQLGWLRLLQLYPGVGPAIADQIMQEQVGAVKNGEELRYESMDPNVAALLSDLVEVQDDVPAALVTARNHLERLLAKKYSRENWDRRRGDLDLLYELAAGHSSIAGFIEQYLVDPIAYSDLHTPSGDAVRVATIHSSKGMEAATVYIVETGPGEYPSARAVQEDTVEDERRVLYVAMTRAKDRLVLTRTLRSNYVEGPFKDGEAQDPYMLGLVPDRLWHREPLPALPKWDGDGAPGFNNGPTVDLGVEL